MSEQLTIEQVTAALAECGDPAKTLSWAMVLTEALNRQLAQKPKITTDMVVRCRQCKRAYKVTVPVEGFCKWRYEGVLIQHAMPGLSVEERELLISSFCGECYDKLWGVGVVADEDEDE